jgi:hypothetical protein
MAKIAVTKEIHESYVGLRLILRPRTSSKRSRQAETSRDDTGSIDASVELA